MFKVYIFKAYVGYSYMINRQKVELQQLKLYKPNYHMGIWAGEINSR